MGVVGGLDEGFALVKLLLVAGGHPALVVAGCAGRVQEALADGVEEKVRRGSAGEPRAGDRANSVTADLHGYRVATAVHRAADA